MQNLFCSSCGTQMNPALIKKIEEGETVLCENCGKEFQLPPNTQDSKKDIDWKKMGFNFKENFKNNARRFGKKMADKVEEMKQIGKKQREAKNPPQQLQSQNHSPNQSTYRQPAQQQQPPQQPSYQQQNRQQRFQQQPPPQQNYEQQTQNATVIHLPRRYQFLRKLNAFTIIYALVFAMVTGIIAFMVMVPNIGNENFTTELYGALMPAGVCMLVFLYDLLYARVQIEKSNMINFGIDFIIVGIIGSVYAYGVGFFLIFKGIVIFFIALTDSSVHSKNYRRNSGEVLVALLNNFAPVIGLVIIAISIPGFATYDAATQTYGYIALTVLLIDLLILRFFAVDKSLSEVNIVVSILKTIFGIMASFYFMCGFLLAIQGILMLFIGILKRIK